jgi:phage-related protein
MLDDCRLLVYPDYDEADTSHKTITATIDSVFPYAQDLTPQTTAVAAGGTQVLANTGSAEYFPVFKVYGPAAGFTISLGVGRELVFTNAIGGGDYVEVNTMNNTIFLNGNEDDELSGLDVLNSVFPTLLPGNNSVSMFDANADVLWAPAYG